MDAIQRDGIPEKPPSLPQQGIRAEPFLSMSCHSECTALSVHLIFPVIEMEVQTMLLARNSFSFLYK